MIQIIEENKRRKPSFAESILGGIAENVGPAIQQYQQQKSISNLLGPEISQLPPEFQKMAMEYKLKSQNEMQKLQGEQLFGQENYETLKNAFGEKFANVWQASPTGGRTQLLKSAIDATLRGDNVNDLIQGVSAPDISKEEIPSQVPQMKNDKITEDFQWPDFSKRPPGYTPKEWNDERKTWRKENSPIFENITNKLKSSTRDALDIKKLNQLNKSEKLPEGFEKLLINPETGDFYGIAQLAGMVSPEAQEWVKVISRFQNRAKDAFGSRVTNFDLQSYMKQFPGLMNTPEGRSRILRMMEINNQLDALYDKAIKKVYQKYGLSGISQEKADELARSFIEGETQKLENEFLELDNMNANEVPMQLSGKMIDVIGPDGQLYEVDQSELDQLPEGFRIQ